MKRGLRPMDVALAIGLCCLPASAKELGERRLTFGGFGTLAAVYHDEEGLEYRRAVNQPEGAQAGEVDHRIDSLAGVQLNGAWNRELEAVAQAVTRYDSDRSWRPRMTRAFIRYVPDEALMLRAGRVGYELLPRADSRDIGYSYLTLRPPVEILGVLPREDFDGGDVTFKRPLGEGLANLKLYAGRTGGKVVYSDQTIDISDSEIWGAHLEYLVGDWILRLGSGVFLVGREPEVDPLIAGLRQTGQPQAQALADDFAEKNRRTSFTVAGITYDSGPAQVRLFLARAYSPGPPGPRLYLGSFTAGYGFGAYTPFVSFAMSDSFAEIKSTGLPDATPQLAALNAAAFDVQNRQQNEQSTLSLGLRYDFAPRMDLKFQVDRVRLRGTSLVLDRNQPPRNDDANMTVLGIGLDFVF